MFSCNKSTEEKIKDGFKEYANKNLDNPDAVESVVDINCIDTLSWNNLVKCSKLCIKNFDVMDSLQFALDRVFKNEVLNDIISLNNNQRGKIRNDFMNYNEICDEYDKFCLMRLIPFHDSTIEEMKKLINQRDSVNYLVYQVKYRIKTNEYTKHIDTCYCYVNNKCNLVFRKTNQLEEMPITNGYFKKLFICNRDYMTFKQQYMGFINEEEVRLNKLRQSIFLAKHISVH